MRWVSAATLFLLLLSGCAGDWRTASRASAGIAPQPDEHPEAVLQVYGADAFGWRGWFAIHTWIAFKEPYEDRYKVMEVIGWRLRSGNSVVRFSYDKPDRYWFGSRPRLLLDIRGQQAQALIGEVKSVVEKYPWANEYRVFPGPNSNTFIAWIGQQVPKMGLTLPLTAVGKGYVD